MRKLFVILLVLVFCISVQAQERIAKRIYFKYENGNNWNDSVGDTLTGVTAGAASVDTIYFSALSGDELADQILVFVKKDTDLLATQGKTDTTLVRYARGLGNFFTDSFDTAYVLPKAYIATDVLGFVTDEFMFEIRTDEGQDAATNYKMLIDHSLMANTDSTAYQVRIYGIFNRQ